MECNEDYSLNLMICKFEGKRVKFATTDIVIANSGNYRKKFCYCELNGVKSGIYIIVCSTFNFGEIGKFNLIVESTNDSIELEKM